MNKLDLIALLAAIPFVLLIRWGCNKDAAECKFIEDVRVKNLSRGSSNLSSTASSRILDRLPKSNTERAASDAV